MLKDFKINHEVKKILILDVIFVLLLTATVNIFLSNILIFKKILANGFIYSDYLTLLIAISTILIPISLELWKELFQSKNISIKSKIDMAWDRKIREVYLINPILNLSIFVILTIFLPTVLNHPVLYFTDLFYGFYVLFSFFKISFFIKAPNLYDLPEFSITSDNVPDKDIMLELLTTTQRIYNTSDKTNLVYVEHKSGLPKWSFQINEESTLLKIIDWVDGTLNMVEVKDRVFISTSWMIFNNYLSHCDQSIIWQSVYNGELKTLLSNKSFYTKNQVGHISLALKTIVSRMLEDESTIDVIKSVIEVIPLNEISDDVNLYNLFESSITRIFEKTDLNSYFLQDIFPKEIQITKYNVNKLNKLQNTIKNIYLNWIRNLQIYTDKPDEQSVINVTEFLFPDVETMLFGKFIIFYTNSWFILFGDDSIYDFKPSLDKWKLFGRMGRVQTSWYSEYSDAINSKINETILDNQDTETIKFVKNLNLFSENKKDINNTHRKFITIIEKLYGDDQDYDKQSWLFFAEKFKKLADE